MPDLKTQFTEFTKEAFRLEALPSYNVKGDMAEFSRYEQGELLTSWADRPWIHRLRDDTANGKLYRRVRLMPSVLTPYLRFTLEWGYPYMAEAGEEILILEEGKPHYQAALATSDFWLFDDDAAFLMDYEPDGSFIGSHHDPDLARSLSTLKYELISAAVPLRGYLARLRSFSVEVPRTS